MSKQPKILFVHSGNESFVSLDREILKEFSNVKDLFVLRKFPAGFSQYLRGVKEADIVFCWFASWNSFWAILVARLYKKPSVLIVGGYDVADLPEAGYGHQRGGIMKLVSRGAMKMATTLLPFSIYSRQEAENIAGISNKLTEVVYLGVPDPFGSLPEIPKARLVLSVGKVDWPNLKRKGLEPFIQVAKLLPDMKFVLVGEWADNSIDHLRSIASSNVIFTGRVSNEELLDYFRQASVYVQASLHEGFGLSVAESMLAGCIPVVTRAGSLPEVVGDCGIYFDVDDLQSLYQGIQRGLSSNNNFRIQVRERILTSYPIEKRRMHLLNLISGHLH